jgi:hypothetical protein
MVTWHCRSEVRIVMSGFHGRGRAMAYDLELPISLKKQGWKVKIANMERVEPPHVTIIRKTMRWRFGLREPAFLDKKPNPGEVPRELIDFITRTSTAEPANDIHARLCAEWNKMYPGNPVVGDEDD